MLYILEVSNSSGAFVFPIGFGASLCSFRRSLCLSAIIHCFYTGASQWVFMLRGIFHNLVMKSLSFTGPVFWDCDLHTYLCPSSKLQLPHVFYPMLPSMAEAVSICFLEALSLVDYVFFPFRWDRSCKDWGRRIDLPSAGIRFWQRLSYWRVRSCYREVSEYISLSLPSSSPARATRRFFSDPQHENLVKFLEGNFMRVYKPPMTTAPGVS